MSDRQLTTLEPDISSLLDAERSIPQAPTGARERVLGRLAVTMGAVGAGFSVGAGAARVAEAAPAPPAAVTSLPASGPVAAVDGIGRAPSASLQLAMSCLVGAAVGGGLIYLLMRRPEPAPTTFAPTMLVLPPSALGAPPPSLGSGSPVSSGLSTRVLLPESGGETGEASPSVAPPPIVERPRPPRRRHHSHPSLRRAVMRVSPALEEESGLEAERAILEGARAALALGDVKGALAGTRQHEHRFPNGQLADARESLLVRALAASGDTTAARARGAAFHHRFPASIFLPAVDATLQSLP